MYATSFHEQSSNIITFAQFEEGHIVENEGNIEEYKSIFPSTDESSKDNDSDDISINKNSLENIQGGSQIHPTLISRDAISKIIDRIKQTQNKWKVVELLENSMVKVLHKLFKSVVNELNNALSHLV